MLGTYKIRSRSKEGSTFYVCFWLLGGSMERAEITRLIAPTETPAPRSFLTPVSLALTSWCFRSCYFILQTLWEREMQNGTSFPPRLPVPPHTLPSPQILAHHERPSARSSRVPFCSSRLDRAAGSRPGPSAGRRGLVQEIFGGRRGTQSGVGRGCLQISSWPTRCTVPPISSPHDKVNSPSLC